MAKDTKRSKKEKTRKDNSKGFFKEFRAELKKVVWPTPKQLVNNTSVVIGMILITAAIVFCLDVAFDNGYQFIVGSAESVIERVENSDTNNTTENAVEENTTEESTTEAETTESESTSDSEDTSTEETDE